MQTKRILVVLDLDETLIHATKEELSYKAHFKFHEYYIYLRPYLHSFLDKLKSKFDVAIWSSADDKYVNSIIEMIYNEHSDFHFIWGRSKCTMRKNFELDKYVFEKHLKKVKQTGIPLENILIVDNSPEKLRVNYGNAIYIKSFYGNQNDIELLKLIDYIINFSNCKNVRSIEKRNWDKNR